MRLSSVACCVALYFSVLGVSIAAAAPKIVDIGDDFEQLALDRDHYLYFLDPEGALSLTDAISQYGSWSAPPEKKELSNYSKRAHWFALQLHNSSEQPIHLIFEFRHPRSHIFNFYTIKNGNTVARYETGQLRPFSSRPITHPHFLFPVSLQADETATLLIHIEGRPLYMLTKTALWKESSYLYDARYQYNMYWAIIGIFAVMVLYNAAIGLFVRDISYLWYVCYVSVVILHTLAISGLGFELVWSNNTWLEQRAVTSPGYVSGLFLGLFAVSIMNMKENSPRMLRVVYAWMALIVIAFLMSVFLPFNYRFVFVGGLFVNFPFLILLWGIGVSLWRKGNQAAKHYVISWAFPVAATFVVAYGYLFSGGGVPLVGELANVVQLVFLSVALAARITELRRSEFIAKAENQAKGEFLAKMSHEIRTPMSGVLGMSELLRDMNLNKQQQKCNDVIYASGKALLTVINDILDYSKIEAGKMQVEVIPFEFEKLAWEVLNIFRIAAEQKQVHLMAEIDPRVPQWVEGDHSRIRQIMINLLSNAIKFTEQGDIILRVLPEENSELIRVEVQDNGIGISQDNQHKLFNPFSQAEASTSRHFGGTGLGLAICKQLALLMGGDIGVKSEPDKGSTFWVTLNLPQYKGSKLPAPACTATLAGKRVLLVDDNANYRHLLAKQAAQWGIELAACDGGHAALKLLEKDKNFDLIISDINMPDMTGIELTQALQQQTELQSIPFVLVTAYGSMSKDSEALSVQVEDKPLVAFELRDLLYRCMGLKADEPQSIAEELMAESKQPFPLLHILVADDNAVNRMVIDGLLRKLGQTITLVANGAQAVEAVEGQSASSHFDLILMDCEMPEMDGFEATEKIRKREQEQQLERLPIYALTAHVMEEHLKRCKACGMDDYLAKPIDSEKLKQALLTASVQPEERSGFWENSPKMA